MCVHLSFVKTVVVNLACRSRITHFTTDVVLCMFIKYRLPHRAAKKQVFFLSLLFKRVRATGREWGRSWGLFERGCLFAEYRKLSAL